MKDNSLSCYVQNYFLSYLISQRGYGDNTIASYRDTFKLLFMFLESNSKKLSKLKLTDISQTCVLQFLEWAETKRHNAVSTRNLRLAVLKSFFSYVLSISPEFSGQCTDIINIPAKKTEKKPPLYLTESETKLLLNAPDRNNREGIRHMAILTLLYDSACRVQELIDLNVADVTIGRCCKVFVKGKGSKYREIPVFGETGRILKYYINAYGLKSDDALFTNRSGERLTRVGVSYIMNKYKKLLREQYADSFDLSLSPHRMRHYGESFKMVSGDSKLVKTVSCPSNHSPFYHCLPSEIRKSIRFLSSDQSGSSLVGRMSTYAASSAFLRVSVSALA